MQVKVDYRNLNDFGVKLDRAAEIVSLVSNAGASEHSSKKTRSQQRINNESKAQRCR